MACFATVYYNCSQDQMNPGHANRGTYVLCYGFVKFASQKAACSMQRIRQVCPDAVCCNIASGTIGIPFASGNVYTI